MDQDEELHAELMAMFRKYFAANQKWLAEGTKRSAIDLRHILSDIRRICSRRRVVIREWTDWKEAELLERKLQRKAQKGKGTEAGDDN